MTPSWKADVAATAPVALNKIRQRNWLTALNCSILKARGKGFAFSGLGPFGWVLGPQMGPYQRPLPVLGTPVRRGTAPISDDFVTSAETVVNIGAFIEPEYSQRLVLQGVSRSEERRVGKECR